MYVQEHLEMYHAPMDDFSRFFSGLIKILTVFFQSIRVIVLDKLYTTTLQHNMILHVDVTIGGDMHLSCNQMTHASVIQQKKIVLVTLNCVLMAVLYQLVSKHFI